MVSCAGEARGGGGGQHPVSWQRSSASARLASAPAASPHSGAAAPLLHLPARQGWTAMAITVSVKWGKKKFDDVKVDPAGSSDAFRATLEGLTGEHAPALPPLRSRSAIRNAAPQRRERGAGAASLRPCRPRCHAPARGPTRMHGVPPRTPSCGGASECVAVPWPRFARAPLLASHGWGAALGLGLQSPTRRSACG